LGMVGGPGWTCLFMADFSMHGGIGAGGGRILQVAEGIGLGWGKLAENSCD